MTSREHASTLLALFALVANEGSIPWAAVDLHDRLPGITRRQVQDFLHRRKGTLFTPVSGAAFFLRKSRAKPVAVWWAEFWIPTPSQDCHALASVATAGGSVGDGWTDCSMPPDADCTVLGQFAAPHSEPVWPCFFDGEVWRDTDGLAFTGKPGRRNAPPILWRHFPEARRV